MKLVTSKCFGSIVSARSLPLCLIVFLLSVTGAYAQTNLSGYWLIRFPNGDGTFGNRTSI